MKNGVFGLGTCQPVGAGQMGPFHKTHHFVSSFLRGATYPKISQIRLHLAEKNGFEFGIFGLKTHQHAGAGLTGRFYITQYFVSSFIRGATYPQISQIGLHLAEKT